MADLINVGTFPNDATGDPARTAFIKVNGLAAGSVPFASLTVGPPLIGAAINVTSLPAGTAINLTDGTVSAQLNFNAASFQIGTSTAHPMSLYTNNLTRVGVSAAGNVNILAPTTGVPLTATGNGAAQVFTFLAAAASQVGAFDSTNASGSFVVLTRSGNPFGYIGNSGALGGTLDNMAVRGQTGVDLITNGGAHLAATITSPGNVTVNPPTSGFALSVTAVSGGGAALLAVGTANTVALNSSSAPSSFNNNGLPLILLNQSGAAYSAIQNDAADTWSIARSPGSSGFALGSPVLQWTTAGNVSIKAPTSSTALSITGVSGGRCIQANASGANFAIAVTNGTAPGLYLDNTSGGAGTAALRIDVSSTTGAATPTGLGTVKPGAATAASQWLPITLNGTLYYIPCWL